MLTKAQIQEFAASLCPGHWLIAKFVQGTMHWRIHELVRDHNGLMVVGFGQPVDDYIRIEGATFVKLVDFPSDPKLWSEHECVAIADAYVAMLEQPDEDEAES